MWMLRAMDAALTSPPQAVVPSQIAVVNLNTMDDELDASSPPSKPMPQVTKKAASTVARPARLPDV